MKRANSKTVVSNGSDKATAISFLLQSIAPRCMPGWPRPEQLIIYDAKGDALPILACMGLQAEDPNVWLLSPFDSRCAVWDLGEAATSLSMARQLATLLVREEKMSCAPYFSDAARYLIYAVILGLNRQLGEHWSLHDLIHALDARNRSAAIAAMELRAASVVAAIMEDDEKFSGRVISTLAANIGRFEEVAARWHNVRGNKRFSISSFLRRPGVLVLGSDPVLKDSIWSINAMVLQALANEILRGPAANLPRHWFVLDEFQATGQLDCVQDLLNRGRSKGASVLFDTQGVPGL